MQYLAPGTNLYKYMKSAVQSSGKIVFPYKFLRSYKDLDRKDFSAYDEFASVNTGQKLVRTAYAASKAAYDADPSLTCFLHYRCAYSIRNAEPFFKRVLEQREWLSQHTELVFEQY